MEYLDASDPELSDFFARTTEARSRIDPELSVIVSEAIDILFAKGLLARDDFSQETQAIWLRRKEREAEQTQRRFAASGFVEIIDDSAFGALGARDPGRRET